MKNGAQHGIIGDAEFGVDIPQTVVPEQDLTEERNAAKFSKTREYKRLKEHLERRIAYYQAFLPNGASVLEPKKSMIELGMSWTVASSIIAELKAIIDAYERAGETVADADRRAATETD